ncbi:replication termination factor 2 [Spea bombifrons]|uniref:replication termination factor 2 n=1 Tax=Spea bombifrons TaxID=233779 RepID=UPI00234A9F51|nr:replication termination factor 2 [Spea bombifrons]
MGCDGGTIPKRHELVKGPKKAEKVDKNAELAARWNYCSLSQERLTKPIVACDLGRLYNKDALIEFLLDKSPDRPHGSAAHIKSIKNVIELNLTDNPAWSGDKSNAKGDAYEDRGARFICPVVGLEMNGRHRFCVLRRCGCVFSERALKEIRTDICHKCGKNFEEDDIILLNGDKEEMEELRRKMEERRLKSKMEKKTKKSKSAKSVPQSEQEPSGSKEITTGEKSSSGDQMNVGSNSKRSADDGSGSLEKTSRSSSSTSKRSLQDDNGKSEAYKSIFSSHSSAKRTKDQACNWISPSTFYI